MVESLVIGIANGAIYGLLAVGIVLVYKGSRVLNFAQGEFGTLGLYLAWVLITKQGWPWLAGAVVAVAVVVLVGLAFERVVIRTMGDASPLSFAVATIGLLFLIAAVEFKVWGSSPQVLGPPITARGVELGGFVVTPQYLIAIFGVAVLALGLAAFFRYTKFGLGILAVAEDRRTARLMGIPLSKVQLFVWGAAAGLGAVAALIIEPAIGAFHPFFVTLLFLRGLAAALIGGLTSLTGAFVGGAVLGILESFVRKQFLGTAGVSEVMLLAVILMVLLLRPQGILARRAV
ncbi:MAG: branched-chain amino acid ABC transporter permease [Actinomycetota bacterium]